MHVTQDRTKVHLIHFPRDLCVPIPGHGKDKINAAYAYGGAPLLVAPSRTCSASRSTTSRMIGFEGFKAMTDAVGGVEVYAEEASTSARHRVTGRTCTWTARQALAFVRERKQLSEGDISRGRRQQAFIKALMLKALSQDTLTNPITLAKLHRRRRPGTSPSTRTSRWPTCAREAFAMRNIRGSDIVFITAPFSGFGTSPDGGSIDVVDEPRMQDLSVALRSDDMASSRSASRSPEPLTAAGRLHGRAGRRPADRVNRRGRRHEGRARLIWVGHLHEQLVLVVETGRRRRPASALQRRTRGRRRPQRTRTTATADAPAICGGAGSCARLEAGRRGRRSRGSAKT